MTGKHPDGTAFWLCRLGEALYLAWSALLDQTKPKAARKDISAAKRIYFDHRAGCGQCTPLERTHENKN